MDELKELNLGTVDEPRSIFISTLLTLAEEKEYLELLQSTKTSLHGCIKKCWV